MGNIYTKRIILASASPRRKELIGLLNIPAVIVSPEIDESFDARLSPSDNVTATAYKKAKQVFGAGVSEGDIVVGCDTVVVSGGEVLTKPTDKEDAFLILRKLSGKTHSVLSGVCIMTKEQTLTFVKETEVEFSSLSDNEINAYIETGEPLDKAGAYAIQGAGALFIKSIKGDYYNVMGLPVNLLYSVLRDYFGCDFA